MRKHNIIAAVAFQKTAMYQQNVWDCAKQHPLLMSTDGSGILGEYRGILKKLAEKHENVCDKHDSTYALALEARRKATFESMQTTDIASKLVWTIWHHDLDSKWFDNWVLLYITLHEKAGMTRVTVHEVMHDTIVVKAKKTTRRIPTSEGTAKFECVYLGNIAANVRTVTDYCACVFKPNGDSRLWAQNVTQGLQSQPGTWVWIQVWRPRNALHVCVDCADRSMRQLGWCALALISSKLRTRCYVNVLGLCEKS